MPNSFGKQAWDMESMFSALEILDDMLALISASTVKSHGKRERDRGTAREGESEW